MKKFLTTCSFFIGGISIGLYDRKNNKFLIKYKSSQEFIRFTNNTFRDFYEAFTKKK